MRVILDFPGRRRVFQAPRQVISADRAEDVPQALAAVAEALGQGRHVAGWLGYELGYALEPRLAPLLQASLQTNVPLLRLGVFDTASAEAMQPIGRGYAGPLVHDWDEVAYAARFARVKDLIAAGDIYQANLSYRARFAFVGDPLALYERLRGGARAPWCGFVDDGARQILSLSPELFFDLSADGVISARPMKGTAPRAVLGGDDAVIRDALAASTKDRAENLMIVDLIRNDLGRVAETGSVAVKSLFAVETYPTLHTLVSTVSARKRGDADVADIVRALFPCGSVTGAPKIRAMEVLRELEDSPRGAYCGAVGFFSPDGTAQFNVAIRTLIIDGHAGVLGIGGGVVQDSQGSAEYAECRLKARFFEEGRPPLQLIETLKWEGMFVRLASHLARMENSARVFGLAFDVAKAREALDRAVTERNGLLRVRLTLDEAGRHEASAATLEANPPHWTYVIADTRVTSTDLLQQHKTSWRALYDKEAGLADEVLFCNEKGELAEGARSNIFIARAGLLLTPPLSAGALDGRLRAELVASGEAREAVLTPADLKNADVYCGNSLRGLIRAVPL
ncbi:MAG TPA: aminodeoxychorismate synthase component I [Rhizomicrobium sp.]|nr:aminodeoxychorismate synthase component I [Rhizomicrobium sp.]